MEIQIVTSAPKIKCAKNNEYILVKEIVERTHQSRFNLYISCDDITQAKSDEKENKNGYYVKVLALSAYDDKNKLSFMDYNRIKHLFNKPLLLVLGRKSKMNIFTPILWNDTYKYVCISCGTKIINGTFRIVRDFTWYNEKYEEDTAFHGFRLNKNLEKYVEIYRKILEQEKIETEKNKT